MYRYFEKIGDTNQISSWKSKGFPDEIVKLPTTSDNCLAPALRFIGNSSKTRVKFDGRCLKQDKLVTHGKTVNIYIVYEINFWDRGYDDYPIPESSLFGAFKLAKNVDIHKYKYFR